MLDIFFQECSIYILSSIKFYYDNTIYKFLSLLTCVSDAIFVVYNYVRLKTILSAYQSKVSENIYPALPSIEETDFSLLTKDVSKRHYRRGTGQITFKKILRQYCMRCRYLTLLST